VALKKDLRALLSPFLLLILIYSVWYLRYPLWQWFEFVEPIFLMLILSYFVVLLLAIFFLKKEAKRFLSEVLKVRNYRLILVGIVFAFLFQTAWFLTSLGIGADLEFLSFPSLKGYEGYVVYSSVIVAFMLYVVFAVFGAFVEEVTFRGYVQSRVASRYNHVIGVFVASLFFSLEHIHIFQLNWVENFFQTQFVYVLCFGIFVGYLFFKSKGDVWSVFAFHALMNLFNISLPIKVTYTFPIVTQLVTIMSFILVILILRLLPMKKFCSFK